MSVLRDVIGAHVLQFERPERALSYDEAAGARLLATFVVAGLILQPALRALAPAADLWGERWIGLAIVLVLFAAVILGVRRFARLELGAIGAHPWASWTPRERIYVLTVVPLAVAAFSIMFREHLARLAETHGWAGLLLLAVPTGILWGMVQEFLYRGLLQTELVRRLGAVFGVLFANLVFTFGPLHFNHFRIDADAGPRWGMFAAIFAIGLLFGLIYRRSGNLWIPALLHGIWPPNMT